MSHRQHRAQAIVIGASAGGIRALLNILTPLPASFHLPIIVVLHTPSGRDTKLADVFQHHVVLSVHVAQDKQPVLGGNLYFAGPNYHLSIERNHYFSLSCEEPVRYSRPSIDVLMTSAADAYGASTIGILLTGANDDGAEGLARIKQAGGFTLVQHPDEAEVRTMPQAAIDICQPDLILSLDEICKVLLNLEKPDAG